jgi:hypothetical protein
MKPDSVSDTKVTRSRITKTELTIEVMLSRDNISPKKGICYDAIIQVLARPPISTRLVVTVN